MRAFSVLQVLLCSSLLFIRAISFAADRTEDSSHSKDSRIGQGDIRLKLLKPFSEPVQIGKNLDIPLGISYRNLPPRSRIYAHLLTLAGDQWIMSSGDPFSMTDPSFSLSGTFVQADRSVFNIASTNYPISHFFKKDSLAQMFGKLWGKELGEGIAEAMSNRQEGYDFTLAFLSSVGEKENGVDNVTLRIKVPDYPHYYNGILITPFVFLYNEDKSQTVYLSAKSMTSVRIPVAPNRPKPLPKEDKISISTEDIPGSISISEYRPTNAVLVTGKSNDIELHVRYQKLQPGTAIYVAPIPTSGDKYVFGSFSASIGGMKAAVAPTFVDGISEFFRIPAKARPLLVSLPFFGDQPVEAALVAVLKNGGDGQVTATISFTPPSYARKYERIQLMPLLLLPTKQGLRVLIDSERLKGPKLLVSEG